MLTSSLSSLSAQHSSARITGIVISRVTQKPIPDATVAIAETNQTTQTDSLGNFSLVGLEDRRYELIISGKGHYTAVLPNISVLKNKSVFITAELDEDIRRLGPVDVKSFRYENSRMRPISSFSFNRDEISLNPGAQGDIFRAIGMLPGVTSSGGIYSAIAVRGQGVRDNVYMVDDLPLTEVGHLEGNSFFNDPNGGRFSIFAPRVIDQANFQGAAFGTEYGRRSASYLGLSIKEGNKGSAIIDGQIDLLGATLNYDGPGLSKKSTLFVSGRYQNFLPLVNLIGLKNLGLPIYGDLIVKSTTRLNSKNKLNVLFMYCPESFVRRMDNLYEDKALNLLYLPDFRRNKIIGSLNLRTITGNKSHWKNIAYFTSYISDVKVGKAYPLVDSTGKLRSSNIASLNPIQTQRYRENKWGLRSVFETSVFNHDRLIIGAEADIVQLENNRRLLVNDTNFVYRKEQLFNPGQKYQVITPDLINADFNGFAPNLSGFINYYFSLHRKITGQAGLRYDYNGFSAQSVIAPRANIGYHISNNHSLSLGWGIFHQDPVYADVADLPTGKKLRMEKVTHYIISYRAYFKHDIKLMVEAWAKTFDHMVVTPVSGSILRNNNGSGYGRGFDVSITKRLSSKWHGIMSYSFMDVMRNDHDGLGEYRFTFSQPNQISLMLSYQLNKKWSFSGKYRYADGRPTDRYIIHANVLNNPENFLYSMELMGRNQNRLPYFSSLDLRMNYGFSLKQVKMTMFFDVVNVLNRQIANSESFNPLSGATYYDGLAIFPTGGLKFEF